jgi:hypothetical protein
VFFDNGQTGNGAWQWSGACQGQFTFFPQESSHMAVTAIKLVGFVMVALTLVSIRRED